ncbi:M14 family zinc carboxypeptidase [Kitasatospora azatica]|uniref:M14 family zinc carboxypeptidase n=1 Tax=Kitasatospora azatica TaxID=58347 RepID=UPI000561BE2E|nr:M14 family zinc carboxypeptidase [Kitasatospora azatica]
MSRKRLTALAAGAIAALAAITLPALPQAAAQSRTPTAQQPAGQRMFVYRITTRTPQDAQRLLAGGFDVLEHRQGADLLVLGDGDTQLRLRLAGFRPSVQQALPARSPAQPLAAAAPGDTYDGGYHTVNSQYAHLDQVASQHADLATVVTYGQSWRKQTGQPNGYDLKAICITRMTQGDCRRDPNSAKPRFFLMSQIHARELSTGEISWRWIDYLTGNYGTDQEVTALLDSTELWVVPIANPDGVDIVQQGGDNPNPQRKNADDSNGSSCDAGGQLGVDLNRNTASHWGSSGTSGDPCSEVYLGPQVDSEAENTALEGLFRELYPAVRGSADSDPAPVDTRGLMITMHSDAGMVIFPWAHDHTVHTGNDAALRSMAGRLGSITGYQSGQAGEILYDAAGGTDDWVYDKLGTAAFTIEVGDSDNRGCDGFMPPYACQDDYFWPKMKPALLYAAAHAAAPYRTTG